MKLKNYMPVHVNNKQEDEEFLEMCRKLQYMKTYNPKGWVISGIQRHFDIYKENTCYYIQNNTLFYESKEYFEFCEEKEIVEFKDLDK